jgi:hypothetical protein
VSLPSSGAIGMWDIEVEAGFSGGQNIWLDHATMRTLAGRPGSGNYIAVSDFYGKSSFSAWGNNASADMDTSGSGGYVTCFPSVTPVGGTGSYTYSWAVNSNNMSATVSNTTSQSCTVQKNVGRNSGGSGTCILQCTVSDTGGHTVTVYNISAVLSWSSSM